MNWVQLSSAIELTKTELTEKQKNQSNPIERWIFELVTCVKQALKSITRSWKLKLLQPRVWRTCFSLTKKFHRNCPPFKCVVKGYQKCCFDVKVGEGFKENRRVRPNCKRARIIRSPSTWTDCFPVAGECFDNLEKERAQQFLKTPAGIMITLFCFVLLTTVDSL